MGGQTAEPAGSKHDTLLTWSMVEPFLRHVNESRQRYSVMAAAINACRASVSQQLGVAPHAVFFHAVMAWHVATGQRLTISADYGFETVLTGATELVHA